MNLVGTGVCLLPAAVTLILLKCSGIDAGAEEPAEAIGFALAAVVLIAVAAAVQFPACILSMGYNLFFGIYLLKRETKRRAAWLYVVSAVVKIGAAVCLLFVAPFLFALFGALTGALAAGISVLSACYLAALVAVEHFSACENKAISQ